MSSELVNLLKAYLMAWKTVFDVAEYLTSIDWDAPDFEKAMAEAIGELELLSTEVVEGFRPEADFRAKASEIVSKLSESAYVQLNTLDIISGASSASITAEADVRVEGAGEASRSWSISPPRVSVS